MYCAATHTGEPMVKISKDSPEATAVEWAECPTCGAKRGDPWEPRRLPEGQHQRPTYYVHVFTMPKAIPDGRVLVHNQVRPTRIGRRGFRAWFAALDAPNLTACDCGWAPELGEHFTIPRGITRTR